MSEGDVDMFIEGNEIKLTGTTALGGIRAMGRPPM
jgi:hypothetical protein